MKQKLGLPTLAPLPASVPRPAFSNDSVGDRKQQSELPAPRPTSSNAPIQERIKEMGKHMLSRCERCQKPGQFGHKCDCGGYIYLSH